MTYFAIKGGNISLSSESYDKAKHSANNQCDKEIIYFGRLKVTATATEEGALIVFQELEN